MVAKLLSLPYFLCFCFVPSWQLSPRIYGGSPASEGQFPWQAALYIPKADQMHFCGGAVISEQWVLTSAGCLDGAQFRIRVLLGTLSSGGDDPNQIEQHATYWVLHEEWDPWAYDNDVGAVQLPTSLDFNDYVQPIALSADFIPGGMDAVISGWGDTLGRLSFSPTAKLRYATVSTYDNSACENSIVTDRMLCTNAALCSGDGGGALVLHDNSTSSFVHIGIASWLRSCGGSSGYARTSFYIEWIQTKLYI